MPQTYDDIVVDDEFAAVLSPLSKAERDQLEQNIAEHGGAREAIVVWETRGRLIILDGHNRYEICSRLGLPFDTHELKFGSREEAADWIDRNQLGRRNLDTKHMSLLLGRRYNRTKRQGQRTDLTSGQSDQKLGRGEGTSGQSDQKLTAARAIASEHGVAEKTVRRSGKFAEAVEKLGIEKEVSSGSLRASKSSIIDAADSLPVRPSSEDVKKAVSRLSCAKKPAEKRPERPQHGVDKCLSLIDDSIRKFLEWHPAAVASLVSLLTDALSKCEDLERGGK